ncbi:von Willebrand factor A domain-containing protein 3B-like [Octopus sinensis]|uniref:von Willebrand factor A domain-containing protein 3B-like n=1 Tax=Octopus sinensis TaxID=2607531 RepID=A0A6P7TQQ0_9MOLL|nr:von Willebrand factor A domain-containing protein 3B-like [Octopus sinensis]XP_036369518.1 von Willebrand factor A domain-containing protein 3B-like [Octopus sinensis]
MRSKPEEEQDTRRKMQIFGCPLYQIHYESCRLPAEATELISSTKWLNSYGLKRHQLDLFSLLPKIGFKVSEEYEGSLQKPVCSKYGLGLFQQIYRSDGKTFNIVCCRVKLQSIAERLEYFLRLYRQRLYWLISGSRKIFGVIEETSICLVLVPSIEVECEERWNSLKKFLGFLLTEQVAQLRHFNIVIVSEHIDCFHPEMVRVCHDSIHKAVEWLQDKPRPMVSTLSICEAVVAVMEDQKMDAIYLIVEGTAKHFCQEILKDKILRAPRRIPVHTVSLNCPSHQTFDILKELSSCTNARFHAYNTDPSFGKRLANSHGCRDDRVRESTVLKLPAAVSPRQDVVLIFDEIEEGRNTLDEIRALIDSSAPIKFDPEQIDDQLKTPTRTQLNEMTLTSEEWLQQNGIHANGLSLHRVLQEVSFYHKDGQLHLWLPPIDKHRQTTAISSVKVIDAKYCSTFPLVKMASGEAMHVYITPKFHRQYEEKMSPVLKNIHQRLHWLKTNNRAIFGSLCEDQIYILIDMSSSMLPKIEFVLEKTESFIKEQLQDKTFNLVIFNKTATAWKKNLAEAAQYCHRDAVSWLQKQVCCGSTNTYTALKLALTDPHTRAIYLLTDGRPDQPAKLLLSQVDMYPTIPVHTVSFNCNDVEANEFLCQLAQLTDGRYRHYNCNTGPHLCRPHCWKSDDQRLLEEELKEASENLDFMSKLRNHCTTAVWKKEISRIKDSKINNSLLSCEGSASSDLSSKGTYQSVDKLEFPVPTHSIPRKCYSFQKNPESFYYKEKSHKFPPQQKNILFAGSTKTSYLRLKNIKKGSRPISRETQEKKAEIKANSSPVCPRPPLILRERKPRSIIKEWLRHNSLRRKKLSLLDVLSSTCIPHGAKYIPVLNKHALTRVFKEVFPFAYLLEEKGMEMNLVNPGAVDLADYEEELAKAIHLYTNYLDAAIWNALPESSKTRFQSDSPVSYLSNKPRLLHALHEAGWPLAKDDVILLEREIEQGFKYLNLAKNLRNHQLADNSSEAK